MKLQLLFQIDGEGCRVFEEEGLGFEVEGLSG